MKTIKSNKDVLLVTMLFIILLLVSIYLQLSEWTKGLEITSLALTIGFVSGLFSSRINSRSISFKYFVGIFISITILLIAFVAQTSKSGTQIEKISLFLIQTTNDVNKLLINSPLETPNLFILIISLVFLFIGYFGSFNLIEKGKAWGTLTIIVFGFLIIDILLPREKQSWVITSIFSALIILFVIRSFFNQKKTYWIQKSMAFEGNSRLESNWSILVMIALIMAVAWAIPSIIRSTTDVVKIREVNSALRNLEGPLKNLTFAMEDSDAQAQTTYPTKYVIGRSITNSEDVIFTIQTDQQLPEGFHYYWRGRVYDFYSDGIWSNSASIEIRNYELNDTSISSQNAELPSLYEVRIRQPLWTFFTTGNIVSIDRDSIFLLLPEADDSLTIAGIFPKEAIYAGEKYTFKSQISVAGENSLIESSGEYPDWITEHYLQLPDTLPSRVIELAQQITAAEKTPYEKVLAITDYLRFAIQYSENVDKLPEGRDLVDWLLFESNEGYCAYYATAEVVLLRSIGIPARLGVGFAQGIEQDRGRSFIVRAKDSHAWPEVYFNNIGWVEFEPTTSLPRQYFSSTLDGSINPNIDRTQDETLPANISPNAGVQENDISNTHSTILINKQENPKIFWLIPAIFLMGLLVICALQVNAFVKKNRVQDLNQLLLIILSSGILSENSHIKKWISHLKTPKVVRDYRKVIRLSSIIGMKYSPSATAGEKIDLLVTQIPSMKDECELLLHEYISVEYQMKTGNKMKYRYSLRKIRKAFILHRLNLRN